MLCNLSSRWLVAFLLLHSLLIPSPVSANSTITQTLFGPERFNYSSNTYSRTFSCPSTSGSFTLTVLNGEGGDHRASSAVVKVNNTTIVGTNDLNSNISQLNQTVSNLAKGSNTLTVKVNGGSGSFLTVTINGVYTLDVHIASPVGGAQIHTSSTTVSGSYVSYASSNNTVKVNNTPATAAGGSFTVANVPLVSGSNVLLATITTTDNLADTDSVTINDNLPPIAQAGSPQSVRADDTVVFDGRSSSDPENATLTWRWSLLTRPVGSLSVMHDNTTVSPWFIPDTAGSYVAQLVVNDGVQDSPPDNVTITADQPNTPPTAVAGTGISVNTGTRVTLDGTGSFDADSDPITFAWNFIAVPQGSLAPLDNATTAHPSFVPDIDGAYITSLTVNDGLVNSAPDNVQVTAITPNAPPTANAGSDQVVPKGTMIPFDGSASFDPEQRPLNYAWNVVSRPSGSVSALDNAAASNPALLADTVGDYVVRLVVNDGVQDSPPDTVVATAVNTAPVAVATAAASNVATGTIVGLDGSGSHDLNGDPLSYHWSVATAPAGSAASVSSSTAVYATFTPDIAGSYTVSLVVNDGTIDSSPASEALSAHVPATTVPNLAGMSQAAAQSAIANASLVPGSVTQASSGLVAAGNIISQSPSAGTEVPQGAAVDLTVSTGPAMISAPVILGMAHSEAQSALVALQLSSGAVTNAYSGRVASGRIITQDPTPGTQLLQGAQISYVLSQGPEPVVIPPDPATVAPTLDKSVPTNVHSSTRFLYEGSNPIQTGVAPGTIALKQAAVVRGQIMDRSNQPFPGVTVAVLNHPEYGRTVSRLDGMFDLAVNGGEVLTIRYSKEGFIPVHRIVDVPWQDFVHASNVVMIPYDAQATTIDPSSQLPIQVARGSVVSDDSGTRQSTILFTQGTGTEIVFPDGSSRMIDNVSIRVTEYTMGANGPHAMPAPLPPTTGYTYCAEFSVDEAVSAGADGVRFSKPLVNYLENYLNVPVGGNIPVGYYDRAKAVWVPAPDGKVIRILGVTGGMADIDSVGHGSADSQDRLSSLGITDSERQKIAQLYSPGASLWRVALSHFTPCDFNFTAVARGAGTSPPTDNAARVTTAAQGQWIAYRDGRCTGGSIIDCMKQTLGESVSVSGTPFSLNYKSDRVPGHRAPNTLNIPLREGALPDGLVNVIVEIYYGGNRKVFSFDNTNTPMSISYQCGDRDVYGNPIQGEIPVKVRIGYVYQVNYIVTSCSLSTFGAGWVCEFVATIPGSPESILTKWQEWGDIRIGYFDARGSGLGGWTLDVHHTYSLIGQIVYRGDGSSQGGQTVGRSIEAIAGYGKSNYGPSDGVQGKDVQRVNAKHMVQGADGSLFFTNDGLTSGGGVVYRMGPDGVLHHLAGGGSYGHIGDGGPALEASLERPVGIAIAPDNSI